MNLNRQTRQTGLSLIELMVAITIGLILMSGAISLFVNNKQTYEVTEDLSRLQESARFAMHMMSGDLRMAGYFGCMDNVENVSNHLNSLTGDDILGANTGIEGFEQGDNEWEPSNSTTFPGTIGGTATGDPVANSDMFTVRYLDGEGATVETPYMPTSSAALKLATGNGLKKGDIVAVSDCSSTDIFQITGPTDPDNTGTLNHNTGNSVVPSNDDQNMSKIYEGDGKIIKFIARRYYVGLNANGGTSLFRRDPVLTGTTIATTNYEIVEGVENMQLLYGEDTGSDRIPDVYREADDVVDWDNVISMRIGLLLRTVDEYGQVINDSPYDVLNYTFPAANDRRRRRVFETTILARNLQ